MADLRAESGNHNSRQARLRGVVAILTALSMVVAACGGEVNGGEVEGEGDQQTSRRIIRFAFAPDPVIDYLTDTGTLAKFEEEWNVRLEMTSSWDEFAFFAGGHGEIVSMATTDMPILQDETDIDPVGFGKYNHERLMLVARCDSGFETMADVEGMKFGVGSPTTTERLVGPITDILHDLTFSLDESESDFELVFADHGVTPELVADGDLAAAYVIPELAVPFLRDGTLCGMYEGRAAFEIYRDLLGLEGHEGVESNLFVADREWVESHPYEVQFMLALWDEGVKLWHENHTEIVGLYPQHFAVESEEDIAYIDQWIQDHQFFADTVYLDQDWVDREVEVFDLIKQTGFMDPETANPSLLVIERDIPDGIDMSLLTNTDS